MENRYLKFIFGPHAIVSTVLRFTIDKLQRWAAYMIGLNNCICDITGVANVWADLLSCWGSTHASIVQLYSLTRLRKRSRRLNTNFHHRNSHAMKERMAMRKSGQHVLTSLLDRLICSFDCVWQPISVVEFQ